MGYQVTVVFDPDALIYFSSANGDYLSDDAFFGAPVVEKNYVTLVSAGAEGKNGDGTLATITFQVVDVKASGFLLSEATLVNPEEERLFPCVENSVMVDGIVEDSTLVVKDSTGRESVYLAEDVNRDGVVNIQDLVIVSSNIGKTGENKVDVNGDGVVDIVDLVKVAAALGNTADAPSVHPQALTMLTAADVYSWLSQAQHLNLTDIVSQRGIKRWFSFHHHRNWKGNVRYIQILRDAVGTYWLYIVTDDTSKEALPATGESVGADFGMDTYLTLSNGEKIQSPEFLKQSLKHLRKLYQSLSRKVKRSNNWWRAVREIARLCRHIANQRRDWHFKLATDLCRRFDLIATGTLNLDGMKRLWGRKVSDLAFGQFVEILKFKCFKHNREFCQVGQWTATTKPCSVCGFHNETLSLSDRQWTCPECGAHHDRDVNAAINILRAACGPAVEQT